MSPSPPAIEAFIARWQGQLGGQERANYAMFLPELCDVLDVPRPAPASFETEHNDYVFERAVRRPAGDTRPGHGRIDLYKRDCFVLEAKQSRQRPGEKQVQQALPGIEPATRGARDANRSWDILMLNARRQAEEYARALPAEHGWPPFILVCDVGHVIETYADFSGQGRNYAQFPDRQSFRIYLEDLRRPEVCDRLRLIWTAPKKLDPARLTARVTRDIAARLASVSKALEEQGHAAEEVAMFLMRCLFTMFASSPGIALLPERSFHALLTDCEKDPDRFENNVRQLWEAMDTGDWAYALQTKVRRFNGEFFRTRTVLKLRREEIGELRIAAGYDWQAVDPSIFGTLLEQALDKTERKRLGAHYTPRAYVERLVVATVIEPLRADWDAILSTVERQKAAGKPREAVATVRAFHAKLCQTRVLDPACGTGNFLYVSLELLKRLEGEVLEALAALEEPADRQDSLTWLAGHSVDPHQFLGLELNPRAAAIAELVLWIGYLQWHFRIKGRMPEDPILQAFHNIQGNFDAVLKADVSLARDARGVPVERNGQEVQVYANPRRPEWPAAEFIVGNPPFIGSKFLRSRLGDEYVAALWAANEKMNESADFVMYWWDHAASLLANGYSSIRRFGFVTTNSITQTFQYQVVSRWLRSKTPISITMAIPDHPWTKASSDAAVVRIAMTVCQSGVAEGALRIVESESGLDTDAPSLDISERRGLINPDLTIGVDVKNVRALASNQGICSPGVKLHGPGFIVSRAMAEHLGLGKRKGLESHVREYRNARDLTQRARGMLVIDLYGLTADQVRDQYPEVYQHVLLEVKEKIQVNTKGEREYSGRNWNNRASYKNQWWIFGEPRAELGPVRI